MKRFSANELAGRTAVALRAVTGVYCPAVEVEDARERNELPLFSLFPSISLFTDICLAGLLLLLLFL